MFFSSTESKMTCGLKVDTNDPEWYKSLSKILRKIKGASYTINAEDGMTYITGRADPSKLLRKLKSSKYADICWVKTGNHTMYGANTGQGMMMEQQPPPAPYNWHNHYPPPPPPHHHHHHHRHHTLPYYQQQRPSIAYSYNDYTQYGYW